VLSNCLHFLIQIGLLFAFVFAFGYRVNRFWTWLVVIWALEIVFLSGLALITSVLDVYYRDVRYLVEASNVVMFWLVPIFYTFEMVPQNIRVFYLLNPIAAVVVAGRDILLQGKAPSAHLLEVLAIVSMGCFVLGMFMFSLLERNVADQL